MEAKKNNSENSIFNLEEFGSISTLGDCFRRLRETAGLSQKDVAEMVIISESYVNLLENNQKVPSIDVVKAIMTKFTGLVTTEGEDVQVDILAKQMLCHYAESYVRSFLEKDMKRIHEKLGLSVQIEFEMKNMEEGTQAKEKDFGNKVKDWRKKNKKTQLNVASSVSLGESYMNLIENNIKLPSMEKFLMPFLLCMVRDLATDEYTSKVAEKGLVSSWLKNKVLIRVFYPIMENFGQLCEFDVKIVDNNLLEKSKRPKGPTLDIDYPNYLKRENGTSQNGKTCPQENTKTRLSVEKNDLAKKEIKRITGTMREEALTLLKAIIKGQITIEFTSEEIENQPETYKALYKILALEKKYSGLISIALEEERIDK